LIMTAAQPQFAHIMFFIIGFILYIYVILDGYGLGVGILSLMARDEEHRAICMGSMGAVWHANQSWLVLLGGILFGAFPLAYGVVFSALYIPILIMLVGFIFRGVAIEYRDQARRKAFWSLAFGWGSFLAALAQGFILGGFLSGLPVENEVYAGSVWAWLNPFAALVALGLVFGFGLLGAAYLVIMVIKTEGDLQNLSYRSAMRAAFLTVATAVVVILWSILKHPFLGARWFAWPGFALTFLPILLSLATFVLLLLSLRQRSEYAPFLYSALFFLLSYMSLAGSLYPYIVPPGITIDMAAASPLSMEVMIIVIVILLPVMLLYNGYQNWVFRGKAGPDYGGYGD